jgi:hypothetical protein
MYADMGKRVDKMLDVLRVQGSFFVDRKAIPEYAAAQNWRDEKYEDEVPDIARVVEGINSAAADLRATLLQVGQKLSTLPPAMVAWDDTADVQIVVEFFPVPERKCYEEADDNEDGLRYELELEVPRHLINVHLVLENDRCAGHNWNFFSTMDDHPLKHLFFGSFMPEALN